MISVAMATCNGSRFIERQIHSILAQTIPADEIVITDDCSLDNTIAILKTLQQQFKTLINVSINSSRLGYAKNFERAIRACSGDTIFLSDQDNVWFPQKIERMLEVDQSALMVHSDAVLVDEKEKIISESYSRSSKKHIEDSSFARILCSNPVSGCTAMIRRELLVDQTGFPEWMPHDQWLAILAADKHKLTYLSECLMSFRQHENNVLGAGNLSQKSGIRISGFQSNGTDHDRKALLLRMTQDLARNIISKKNVKIVDDLALYHESLGRKGSGLRATILYSKYSKYIDFGEPRILRTLKCLATLFRTICR